jgi:hypothetical protein
MRVTWLLMPGLAALALTVSSGCHSRRAQAKARGGPQPMAVEVKAGNFMARIGPVQPPPQPEPVNPAPPADEKVLAAWEKVEGWGRDQEGAVQDASEKAQKLVVAVLRRQEPPLAWTPPTSYIRKHLLAGPPTRQKEQDQVVAGIPTQCWSVSVKLTADQLRAMMKKDRDFRAEQHRDELKWRTEHRMRLAGLVTAGLLVVLLGVSAFLRLDDWVGGAYTRGLRRFLSASGAGVRSIVCCKKRPSGGARV